MSSEYVFILEGHQIPSREERKKEKAEKWYRELNKLWMDNKMSYVQHVGHTMSLIKASKALTHKEWVEYYLERQGGLQRLVERIRVWSELSGLDMMRASIFHIIKVLDDTWAGRERELIALDMMKAVGKPEYLYRLAREEEDIYGLDIIVEDSNERIVGGVQVKPVTFFLPPRYSSWEGVMQRGLKHMMRFRESMNAPCFYLVPEENEMGQPLKYRKIEETPLTDEAWKAQNIREHEGVWFLA